MATRPPPDGQEPKIIVLFDGEEQAGADALALYWDATVKGRPADPGALDQELIAVVQLLRHYHLVTRHRWDSPITRRSAPERACAYPFREARHRSSPALDATSRPLTRGAIAMVGLFVLIFTINTIVSPRSWLLSTAEDPDWIPWVSDDWLVDSDWGPL
jgi:hypothetical protein